ncbi:recombinase family protein [Ottowia testudinis]|uniref:Recombinase family protein n=1 Tax=Ottowia testudinis TaxID=2816950 RepID=A0A975H4V6_9BURK|nr:recombinase family protein [Ottowia testudinis]QTD44312.1 recombinase family protein [Ottowia testudinis]
MKIGYARVSTQDQDNAMQLIALKEDGCKRIFEEKASGAKFDRPILWQCIESLKTGDQLVFYKLDRVARSLSDLLQILERVEKSGASIKSLTEPIDTGSAAGRLMLQILGAMAEFERSLIRERSIAGQREARARGKQFGRPLSVDEATASAIVDEYLTGLHTLKGVAQRFGVSPSVVKRLVYKKTKPSYRS